MAFSELPIFIRKNKYPYIRASEISGPELYALLLRNITPQPINTQDLLDSRFVEEEFFKVMCMQTTSLHAIETEVVRYIRPYNASYGIEFVISTPDGYGVEYERNIPREIQIAYSELAKTELERLLSMNSGMTNPYTESQTLEFFDSIKEIVTKHICLGSLVFTCSLWDELRNMDFVQFLSLKYPEEYMGELAAIVSLWINTEIFKIASYI